MMHKDNKLLLDHSVFQNQLTPQVNAAKNTLNPRADSSVLMMEQVTVLGMLFEIPDSIINLYSIPFKDLIKEMI